MFIVLILFEVIFFYFWVRIYFNNYSVEGRIYEWWYLGKIGDEKGDEFMIFWFF